MNLLKLPAHLLHHPKGRPSHCPHGISGKEKGNNTSNKEASHHVGVHDVDLVQPGCLNIGGKESQSRERRRANGKPLGNGRSRITGGIEGVSDLAHVSLHMGHLGNTAGVIRDRSIGIDRYGNASNGKHADG